MTAGHEHDGDGLFCDSCGKVKDRAALKSVGLVSFTGRSSLSPAMEAFRETGDPSVFSKE